LRKSIPRVTAGFYVILFVNRQGVPYVIPDNAKNMENPDNQLPVLTIRVL
jgi:hypothetical protein